MNVCSASIYHLSVVVFLIIGIYFMYADVLLWYEFSVFSFHSLSSSFSKLNNDQR